MDQGRMNSSLTNAPRQNLGADGKLSFFSRLWHAVNSCCNKWRLKHKGMIVRNGCISCQKVVVECQFDTMVVTAQQPSGVCHSLVDGSTTLPRILEGYNEANPISFRKDRRSHQKHRILSPSAAWRSKGALLHCLKDRCQRGNIEVRILTPYYANCSPDTTASKLAPIPSFHVD